MDDIKNFWKKRPVDIEYEGNRKVHIRGNAVSVTSKLIKEINSSLMTDHGYSKTDACLLLCSCIKNEMKLDNIVDSTLYQMTARMFLDGVIITNPFEFAISKGLLKKRSDGTYEPIYSLRVSNIKEFIRVWEREMKCYRDQHHTSTPALPNAKALAGNIWVPKTKRLLSGDSARKYIAALWNEGEFKS